MTEALMQRIGLVLKKSAQSAIEVGDEICRFLAAAGRTLLVEAACQDLADRWGAEATETISDDADLLVSLGGDGTILRVASLVNSKPIPVLGINLGRVGYMAEVSPGEAVTELRAVLEGAARFVERMMLQVTLPDGRSPRVLNEAVIHWGGIARLIDLHVKIGEAKEIEVRADGLIVSTPIGSSAYSYAANGPLVHPDIEAILLTPICPYSGLQRTLLIPSNRDIRLFLKAGKNLTITLDGHATENLEVGQTVGIARSSVPFVMARSKKTDYFAVLKEKLNLLK
jgi:NAD+ kinase